MRRAGWIATVLLLGAAAAVAELADTLGPSADHPAIRYFDQAPRDPVSELNARIASGAAHLRFEAGPGYLRSILEALQIPIESQVVVFSKTRLQAPRIEPDNPRTIFFNDSTAVAWVRGGFVEVASQDPEQGVIFHSLEQVPASSPRFQRRTDCLRCHISEISLGVPGMMVRSRYPAADGSPRLILGGFTTDHRSPWEERWGGWYVTGTNFAAPHLGNTIFSDDGRPSRITAAFDRSGYLSAQSDIAALLVFDHQMHMMNLLTRLGWDARAARRGRLRQAAEEFVDYLLFVDEAPLPPGMHGSSAFAAKFASRGPTDSRGRSLRQLDLQERLLRYPCSYMIYTEAFDHLPSDARTAIYERMWRILSGEEKSPRYARLTGADRQAVVEILRETKKGLPGFFQGVVR